jgi:hypothetical protein
VNGIQNSQGDAGGEQASQKTPSAGN